MDMGRNRPIIIWIISVIAVVFGLVTGLTHDCFLNSKVAL